MEGRERGLGALCEHDGIAARRRYRIERALDADRIGQSCGEPAIGDVQRARALDRFKRACESGDAPARLRAESDVLHGHVLAHIRLDRAAVRVAYRDVAQSDVLAVDQQDAGAVLAFGKADVDAVFFERGQPREGKFDGVHIADRRELGRAFELGEGIGRLALDAFVGQIAAKDGACVLS